MTQPKRGFSSALSAPLLQAEWGLEAAKQDVATTRRALQDKQQLLDSLQQVRGELLAYCLIYQGARVDPATRSIQLTYLAEIDARLSAAKCAVADSKTKWATALTRCAAKQQRRDHLNDMQKQLRIAFEREQRQRNARYADDEWLMRRPLALVEDETS